MSHYRTSARRGLQWVQYQNARIVFENLTIASVLNSPKLRNAALLSDDSRKYPHAKMRVNSVKPEAERFDSRLTSKENSEMMKSILQGLRYEPSLCSRKEAESEESSGGNDVYAEDEEYREVLSAENEMCWAVDNGLDVMTVEEKENMVQDLKNAQAEVSAWNEGQRKHAIEFLDQSYSKQELIRNPRRGGGGDRRYYAAGTVLDSLFRQRRRLPYEREGKLHFSCVCNIEKFC